MLVALSAPAGATLIISSKNIGDAEKNLIAVGEDKIQILQRIEGDTLPKVIWQWTNSDTNAKIPSAFQSYFKSMDECKPFVNNTRLLACSSSGGVMLIDVASKACLFYAYCPMAHSLEMLPNNRIGVVLSTHNQGNALRIYDASKSNVCLFSDSLYFGHGIVWNEKRQRLYALGYDSLRCYKLKDWQTSSPKLTLEHRWLLPAKGGHELSPVSDNSMMLSMEADNHVYFFNIDEGSFTAFHPLDAKAKIKSLNLNRQTGQYIYTQAETSWWTTHIYSQDPDWKITTTDIDKLYKVRTFK